MRKLHFLLSFITVVLWSNVQAAVITDGFDYVESMIAGSQNFTNNSALSTDSVYALISMKDMKTYTFDDVYQKQEDNIDMKFYIMGGTTNATVRLYAMDGTATTTKNNEYPGSNEKTVDNFIIKNTTKFMKITGVDFDAATAAQVKSLNLTTASNTINPVEVNDIIAFKTAGTSAAGGHRNGLIKIVSIVRETPESSRGTITVSIKLAKPEPVVSEGFDYVESIRIGTYGFAGGTQPGYENVFSLYSIKDRRTYRLDDIKTNLINVDMKFHLQGSASEPRVYCMNNKDSKNPQFKTSDNIALSTLLTPETTNETRYLTMPSSFSYESATIADVEAINEQDITLDAIKPTAIGNVIAYKAGPTSTAAGTKGVFKIYDIVLTHATNKELGYFVVSFKQLPPPTSGVETIKKESSWKQIGQSIQIINNTNGIIKLYDTIGRLVLSKNVTKNETVDLSSLKGIYVVQFNNERSKIFL
ncbi:MAG: T9SS type A sorting domain-containing protein [Paludibacter sp.]|nr:T9SS type A sorting domain-containing protein [Paludibacter sp.]